MTKNVTIRLDEAILKKCRHRAIGEDKSLSQWISDVLIGVVSVNEEFQAARESPPAHGARIPSWR